MLLDDIEKIITNANAGFNVFLGWLPAKPAAAIALILTTGYGNEFDLDGSNKHVNQGLQTLIRAPDAGQSYTMAAAVEACLDGKPQTVNGTYYTKIFKVGGTVNLGLDEQGHNTLLSLNFIIEWEENT